MLYSGRIFDLAKWVFEEETRIQIIDAVAFNSFVITLEILIENLVPAGWDESEIKSTIDEMIQQKILYQINDGIFLTEEGKLVHEKIYSEHGEELDSLKTI